MKSFAQLAKSAFAAYLAAPADPAWRGIHPWEKLEPEDQARWVAAVKQVIAELAPIQ